MRDAEGAKLDVKRIYTMRDAQSTEKKADMAVREAFYQSIVKRDATTTGDVAVTIPTEIIEKVVEKMGEYGTIFNDVTHTHFAGGKVLPVEVTRPKAEWIDEGETSAKNKGSFGKIIFSYHKLRCEVHLTQEVYQMTLPVFEKWFSDAVARAMVEAIEKAIIQGDGLNMPKGIIANLELDTTNNTIVTKEATPVVAGVKYTQLDYATLVNAEVGLRGTNRAKAKWYFTGVAFADVLTLTDQLGRPIVLSTLDAEGKIRYNILGRPVEIIDEAFADAVIKDNAGSNATAVGAILMNPEDYILNTVYDLGVQKKVDWDNENYKIKAVMSVDGVMATPVGEPRVYVLAKG